MVKKGSKMVNNGGRDLKRARRTGLSARRARRTKSRGPNGLQLEVGARRAPRLVDGIYMTMSQEILFTASIFISWRIQYLLETVHGIYININVYGIILRKEFYM